MGALLMIYAWTIVGGVLTAAALALLGAWLASRDRAMQTLCVGQGATLGVLFALGLSIVLHLEGSVVTNSVVFSTAVAFSAITFYLSEALVKRRHASQNTYFTFLFVTIMAFSYLVSALFPGLESHMSQTFFGDLATMTTSQSLAATFLSGVALLLFIKFAQRFTNISFEESTFTSEYAKVHHGGWTKAFLALTLVYICFSVQTVGFLFTAVCLFLPTSLVSFANRIGLRQHLTSCSLLAALATACGFLLSLAVPSLPTVPTITATAVVLGSSFAAFSVLLGQFSGR